MPEFLIDQKQHQNKDMRQGKQTSTFKSQENKRSLQKQITSAGSNTPKSSHHPAIPVLCNTTIFRKRSRHDNTAVPKYGTAKRQTKETLAKNNMCTSSFAQVQKAQQFPNQWHSSAQRIWNAKCWFMTASEKDTAQPEMHLFHACFSE